MTTVFLLKDMLGSAGEPDRYCADDQGKHPVEEGREEGGEEIYNDA
jgi:hypothetical protein